MLPNDTIDALTSVRLTSYSRLRHQPQIDDPPQIGSRKASSCAPLLPIHDSRGVLEERFAPVAQEPF
jgi:hypothetical protein